MKLPAHWTEAARKGAKEFREVIDAQAANRTADDKAVLDALFQESKDIAKKDAEKKAKRGKRDTRGSNALTASVLRILTAKGCLVWRCNSGAAWMPIGGGRYRPVRFAPAGTPDIIGIAADGRFIAVEVKYGPDKLSEIQTAWLSAARKRGAIAGVARCPEDALAILNGEARLT